MADDGMLLNFSIPESGIIAKPSIKGGSWRSRLTAKKAAQNWHTKATARLNGEVVPKKVQESKGTDVNRTELGPRTRRVSTEPSHSNGHGNGQSHSHGDSNGNSNSNSNTRNNTNTHTSTHSERPAKRARVSGAFQPNDTHTEFRPQATTGAPKHLDRHHDAHDPPKKGNKQVISSLFTYNPTSTTKPHPADRTAYDDAHDAPIEPSNAPLSSELDTFTSLGIAPTLATHMLNKMGMKAPTAIQKAAIAQLLKDDSDAFIQAETGSGKTLAYLLPIVQRLMELSANMKKRNDAGDDAVQRTSGLFAVILAPTRELSKQIATVLEKLLGCAHWLVATTVIGGEKKKSEKARLRKGINILVATPGRLVDHLEHTEALDVSNVRWLVLDEGDRMMELGFEQDMQKIIGQLNLRMRAHKEGRSAIPGLPAKRTTVLCSATMKMDVERLGQISLKDAVHIKADPADRDENAVEQRDDEGFYAPAQLKQSYAVVAPKLRLVSLLAYLKRTFARKGSVMKAIVFISCADSVDFHFDLLTNLAIDKPEAKKEDAGDADAETGHGEKEKETDKKKGVPQSDPTKLVVTHAESPILSPKTHAVTVYRLHGSLQQSLRTSTLAHFSKNTEASVLIATDVASRGLDLPNVDLVVEFDPAFARSDHLHRIGRTARAGRDGRACVFLQPGCEEGYVEVLKSDRKDSEVGVHLVRQDADDILNKGLITTGIIEKGAYMEKATDLQLAVERWALADPKRLEAARRAYQSHIRAYATHVADEHIYFDIKSLHLGHLAKAFALRERPSGMKVPGLRTGAGREDKRPARARGAPKVDGASRKADNVQPQKGVQDLDLPLGADEDESAKMRKAVRAREKFMRHAGMASEFNLG